MCDSSQIWKNVLVDNTDIDVIVGGGPDCSVLNNTIWHGGKHAFAGLAVGNFNDNGMHTGSHFSGNRIINTVISQGEPGKFIPWLNIGLLVGSHPWRQAASLDVKDTGTVGPSAPIAGRPDLDVGPNHIEGANANLVIDGAWNSAQPDASIPGQVIGNDPKDPTPLPPSNMLSNIPCAIQYKYTVNPPHAKMQYDGDPTVLVYHNLECAADPNDPAAKAAVRSRVGSQ